MAMSLNKVLLIGNLGKDADTRFTTNNLSVTSFSLATTNSYKDKNGEWKNETTWHNCVAFSLSDWYKNALKKGAKFYVEGRIQKNDYTDKDGVKRYNTDVIVEKLIPLDSKSASTGDPTMDTSNLQMEEPETQAEGNEDLPF